MGSGTRRLSFFMGPGVRLRPSCVRSWLTCSRSRSPKLPLMLPPTIKSRCPPESEPAFGWFRNRVSPSLPLPLQQVVQVRRRTPVRWLLQQSVMVRRPIPVRFLLPVENSSRGSFLEPVGPRVIQKAPVLSWFQLHFLPPIRTPLSWR